MLRWHVRKERRRFRRRSGVLGRSEIGGEGEADQGGVGPGAVGDRADAGGPSVFSGAADDLVGAGPDVQPHRPLTVAQSEVPLEGVNPVAHRVGQGAAGLHRAHDPRATRPVKVVRVSRSAGRPGLRPGVRPLYRPGDIHELVGHRPEAGQENPRIHSLDLWRKLVFR